MYFPLTEEKTRLISVFGSGILIGTSLIVIIPEGADAVYTSDGADTGATRQCLGVFLVSGFIIMYLMDKVSGLHGHSHEQFERIDLEALRTDGRAESAEGTAVTENKSKPSSISVGLVIHAITDGIALGASVAAENSALETIVFVAILVHKAPASFGLTAVLIGEGRHSDYVVKRDLLVFAGAAPLGAIATYILIALLGSSDMRLIQWWTGMLLVFSGGTFLYVAMHVLQEIGENISSNDLLASTLGMVVPLVTLLVPDL